MNFDEALQAHSQWKLRLSMLVNGSSKETFDTATVGADNRCALGQWLYGEGKRYSTFPEYRTVLQDHAAFHRAAAAVVRHVESGQNASAATSIAPGGEFDAASKRVIAAIRRLRDKAETVTGS